MPTPDRSSYSRRSLLAGVAGVALVGVATAGAVVFNREDTASAGSASAPTTAAAGSAGIGSAPTGSAGTASSASSAAARTYKNGRYTETGDYDNPGGGSSITVTVTLADDVITATSATGSETSGGPSAEYQNAFISAYASEVVGKDIDSVSLSRVSGSSLTSNGFNAALAKIKTDAKS